MLLLLSLFLLVLLFRKGIVTITQSIRGDKQVGVCDLEERRIIAASQVGAISGVITRVDNCSSSDRC